MPRCFAAFRRPPMLFMLMPHCAPPDTLMLAMPRAAAAAYITPPLYFAPFFAMLAAAAVICHAASRCFRRCLMLRLRACHAALIDALMLLITIHFLMPAMLRDFATPVWLLPVAA